MNVSCQHNKKILLFLCLELPFYMDDRAASTVLISDGGDRVTPLEGRGDLLRPFSWENPFFDSLSPFCLHSSLNVSKPEREGDGERGKGRSAVCWEWAIESIHDDTHPPFSLMSY